MPSDPIIIVYGACAVLELLAWMFC